MRPTLLLPLLLLAGCAGLGTGVDNTVCTQSSFLDPTVVTCRSVEVTLAGAPENHIADLLRDAAPAAD